MTYTVSGGTLNPTHSLTHSLFQATVHCSDTWWTVVPKKADVATETSANSLYKKLYFDEFENFK